MVLPGAQLQKQIKECNLPSIPGKSFHSKLSLEQEQQKYKPSLTTCMFLFSRFKRVGENFGGLHSFSEATDPQRETALRDPGMYQPV